MLSWRKGFHAPADIAAKIAIALGVTVEFLVTGEGRNQDIPLDHNIRSIVQILTELKEKDVETILGLAKVLRKQG